MSPTKMRTWTDDRPKFTIRRLMIVVAALAPFFTLSRNREAGEIFVGMLIVGACVVALVQKLTSDAIVRKEHGGRILSRRRKLGIGLTSTMVAIAVIGSADLAFFAVYETQNIRLTDRGCHSTHRLYIQISGLLYGTCAALIVAVCWRFVLRRLRILVSPTETSLVNPKKS